MECISGPSRQKAEDKHFEILDTNLSEAMHNWSKSVKVCEGLAVLSVRSMQIAHLFQSSHNTSCTIKTDLKNFHNLMSWKPGIHSEYKSTVYFQGRITHMNEYLQLYTAPMYKWQCLSQRLGVCTPTLSNNISDQQWYWCIFTRNPRTSSSVSNSHMVLSMPHHSKQKKETSGRDCFH